MPIIRIKETGSLRIEVKDGKTQKLWVKADIPALATKDDPYEIRVRPKNKFKDRVVEDPDETD